MPDGCRFPVIVGQQQSQLERTQLSPDERGRQVEAYVLDRDDLELYGEIATYEFGLRLRETIAFDGLDPLLIQMAQDCDQTRNFAALER